MTWIVLDTAVARSVPIISAHLVPIMSIALLLWMIVSVNTSGEPFLSEVLKTVKLVEFTVNCCSCWLRSVDVTNQSCGMEIPWLLTSGGTKFQIRNVLFVMHGYLVAVLSTLVLSWMETKSSNLPWSVNQQVEHVIELFQGISCMTSFKWHASGWES